MVVTVNDVPQAQIDIDGRKEVEIPYPYEVKDGDKLEIKVNNVNDAEGSFAGMFAAQ